MIFQERCVFRSINVLHFCLDRIKEACPNILTAKEFIHFNEIVSRRLLHLSECFKSRETSLKPQLLEEAYHDLENYLRKVSTPEFTRGAISERLPP